MSESGVYRAMYPGFYQTAYVTNDLEHAMGVLGEVYGIKKWMTVEGFAMPVKSGENAVFDVALANLGETQFELILPVSGDCSLYRSVMLESDGFQLVFHHICKAFETDEAFLANRNALKSKGIDLPMDNSDLPSNGSAYACYADFREQLGHYLEFVWFTEAGREWMKSVPSNG